MTGKECSQKTNELVLDKFDELTIIAKEETQKALEWLKKQKKKKKKDEQR